MYEVDLKSAFKKNEDALNLARICLEHLRTNSGGISDKELSARVIEEALHDVVKKGRFIIGSSDYIEKEKKLSELFSTKENNVLDTLIGLERVKSEDIGGVTFLSYNPDYIPNLDYYG